MPGLRWMMDTNAVSELIRQPAGPVAHRLATEPPDAVCTNIVVASELRFGAQRKGSMVLTARVDQLLAVLPVLPFAPPADEHCAAMRAALERAGTPIGSHDLFIAAHARALSLTLVTHNVREFARVPGLALQDWQGPAPA